MKCIVHRSLGLKNSKLELFWELYTLQTAYVSISILLHALWHRHSASVSRVNAAIHLCTKYLWKNLDCEDSLCKIHLWDLKVRVQGLSSPRNAQKPKAATCTGESAWSPPSRHHGSSPYPAAQVLGSVLLLRGEPAPPHILQRVAWPCRLACFGTLGSPEADQGGLKISRSV